MSNKLKFLKAIKGIFVKPVSKDQIFIIDDIDRKPIVPGDMRQHVGMYRTPEEDKQYRKESLNKKLP